MFCMKCGQALPDDAMYCMKCGTPCEAVSSTVSTQSETINLDGMHTFIPAMCPNCNAHMKVDSSSKVARCDTCATECLIQDAIKTLTVRGNVQVGNATINVNGTNTDSLLQRVEMMLADGDFSGAMAKCNIILDSDPTNGRAYFFMLMSSLQCRKRNDLTTLVEPFDENPYYLKAMQYGDSALKNELQGYINAIDDNPKCANVGDEILFGNNNGCRISWKILDINIHRALIICCKHIANLPYHTNGGDITWEKSSLRTWLNRDFIERNFTHKERIKILPSQIITEKNAEYNIDGGSSTTDKVFLLSVSEAKKYFADNKSRETESRWWLRSPGNKPTNVAFVYQSGLIDTDGRRALFSDGVRPAMWIEF